MGEYPSTMTSEAWARRGLEQERRSDKDQGTTCPDELFSGPGGLQAVSHRRLAVLCALPSAIVPSYKLLDIIDTHILPCYRGQPDKQITGDSRPVTA